MRNGRRKRGKGIRGRSGKGLEGMRVAGRLAGAAVTGNDGRVWPQGSREADAIRE